MSKIEALKTKLTQAFGNFADVFVEITDTEAAIIDYKNDGSFVLKISDEDVATIEIRAKTIEINHSERSKKFNISHITKVGFVPIDGRKGLIGFGTSQCDFVFFDETNFCFVEFKLNATSKEESAIAKNRGGAINQLLSTITFFDDKLNRNYETLTLEAYVCTPDFYPKANSSWQGLATSFLETNGIELFEANNKICN